MSTSTSDKGETRVIRGEKEVFSLAYAFLERAISSSYLAATSDKRIPRDIQSAIEYIKQMFVKNKHLKFQLISDIQKGNVEYYEKLIESGVEVRHIEGNRVSFALTKNEYIATPLSALKEQLATGSDTPREVMWSTRLDLISQADQIFQMMWQNAKPGQYRIKELREGWSQPQTRIIRDQGELVRLVGTFLLRAAESRENSYAYGVSDRESTRRASEGSYYKVAQDVLSRKGFKIHLITDIQKEDIEAVNRLLQIGYEVRHLEDNRIRFSVSRDEYVETIHSNLPGGVADEMLWSNDPQLVAQGTRIFDALWKTAIPAKLRIEELESGTQAPVMEIIRTPALTREIYSKSIAQAKQEVLLLLPTTNAFHRVEEIGIVDSLREAAKRGARVRLLSPVDDTIRERYARAIVSEPVLDPQAQDDSDKQGRIRLTPILEARVSNAVSVLVVDRSLSLVVEEREPSATDFDKSVGFATYSTTKPTVNTSIRFIERAREEAESRQREEALLEMEKRSRRQAELLQDILTHDIRNYIQVSKLSVELVKAQFDPSRVSSLLDSIEKAADNTGELVERTKRLAKIIGQKPELMQIDLRQAIERSAKLITEANRNRKIVVSVSSSEDSSGDSHPVIVNADELIDEVFVNILSNSVKYTPSQEVLIEVRISRTGTPDNGPEDEVRSTGISREERTSTQDGKCNAGLVFWQVDISDHGAGIHDDVKPKVFTRYQKTASGSGLGLSIVHALVVGRYGGQVSIADRVEGDSSKGTKVTMVLPGGLH